MNHPTEDQLLLLAYGELPEPHAVAIESHVTACRVCGDQLAQLERARVALDVALPERRPVTRWAALGTLAAAAAVVGVLLTRTPPAAAVAAHGWNPTTVWSATAGYVAGGNAVVDIDAQLTRLEQERSYALPN
jgi:anti-sigma factor ChrR (cupin superfamily)